MKSLSKSDAAQVFEGMMGGEEEGVVSASQNVENRDNVVENWSLGPEKTSINPKANGAYWRRMAALWEISEDEARRRFCANCEYFDNTVERQEEMETIPLDKLDADGGGRGYCVKFDFICHNLRTCQAWEPKPFDSEED